MNTRKSKQLLRAVHAAQDAGKELTVGTLARLLDCSVQEVFAACNAAKLSTKHAAGADRRRRSSIAGCTVKDATYGLFAKSCEQSDQLVVMLPGQASPALVRRQDYVRAKHRQLVEFGYGKLTLAETDAQVTAVLAGKTLGDGLTVIGMFMKDELQQSNRSTNT